MDKKQIPNSTNTVNKETSETYLDEEVLNRMRKMYKRQKKEKTPVVIKQKVSVIET